MANLRLKHKVTKIHRFHEQIASQTKSSRLYDQLFPRFFEVTISVDIVALIWEITRWVTLRGRRRKREREEWGEEEEDAKEEDEEKEESKRRKEELGEKR